MGQGQEFKTRREPHIEVEERGEIFFFYRPKVDKEEAHRAEDVQRLYLVLRAESGERPVEEKQDPHSGKEAAVASGKMEGGHGSQVNYYFILIYFVTLFFFSIIHLIHT